MPPESVGTLTPPYRQPVSGSGAAGTRNSTNVRLTRRKSTLFQWLAVPLWVPTGKGYIVEKVSRKINDERLIRTVVLLRNKQLWSRPPTSIIAVSSRASEF